LCGQFVKPDSWEALVANTSKLLTDVEHPIVDFAFCSSGKLEVITSRHHHLLDSSCFLLCELLDYFAGVHISFSTTPLQSRTFSPLYFRIWQGSPSNIAIGKPQVKGKCATACSGITSLAGFFTAQPQPKISSNTAHFIYRCHPISSGPSCNSPFMHGGSAAMNRTRHSANHINQHRFIALS
jgi:hypothetical protein